MAFRNPLRKISGDQVVGGTMSGVKVQTGSTGLRVVLDPAPDSSTGTTDPALLMYSGDAHEQRPGSVSANVNNLIGNESETVTTIKAPDAAGKRQPQLQLHGDTIDTTTGVPTGSRSWFYLSADTDTLTEGYANLTGTGGTTGTPGSAYMQLSTRDDTGAGGGGFTDFTVDKSGVKVAGSTGNAEIKGNIFRTGTSWTAPGYKANWVDATLFQGLGGDGLKAHIMPDDTVWLVGLCKANAGAGTTIATLPVGFRPASGTPHGSVQRQNSANTLQLPAEIAITTAGDVIVSAVTAGDAYSFNLRIPLRNVAV